MRKAGAIMSAAEKQLIRQDCLAKRDALDPAWRAAASDSLAGYAADLAIKSGSVIAGFLPIRSEINPRPLLRALEAQGLQLSLPAILDAETIVFRAWASDAPLVEMGFKTMGPAADAAELDPQVVLMPLAGFDAAGNRLGYGGGFYDRALARMAARGLQPRLIGMAFSVQEVAHIPAERHDLPIAEILTEKGLRQLGEAAKA